MIPKAKVLQEIIPTIPQSDADCDEVGHQQGHGPSLPANIIFFTKTIVTGINKYSEIGNVSAVKMESVIQ